MNVESMHNFCLGLRGVTAGFPFDEETLVFKVTDKIFAIIPLEDDGCISLKCDPERAQFLREHYEAIVPAYHMNKKHWNSVYTNRLMDQELVKSLILHSYELVVKGLPQHVRRELKEN